MKKLKIILHYLPLASVIFFLILSMSKSSIDLAEKIKQTSKYSKLIGLPFDGNKFSGLEQVFKDIQYVGYYTDKDLKKDQHAKQYSQAQYILAPTVLDTNYAKHDFILLDCSTPEAALKIIKELDLIALKKNNFNIVLTRKRP